MAAKEDDRYERAALRWHARLEQEVPALTFEDSLIALSALAALDRRERDETAHAALAALARRHGLMLARFHGMT